MEEKKEIKVKLSTVIYLIIIIALVIALGVMYYFGFVVNKDKNVGEENFANTIENKVDKEIEEDITDVEEENQIATVSKRDKAIKELKKALTNEKWVKENLYLKENYFEEKISEKEEQFVTFEVVDNEKVEVPIIVVRTEHVGEYCYSISLSIIRYKNDEVSVENWGRPLNASRVDYEIKDDILITSWAAMGDWSYSVCKWNEELTKLEGIEEDEGSNDEGYRELEKVKEKYSTKPISKKLNNSNVERYIK